MTEEPDYAKEQAQAQYESICEMVAALDVDYDRLEELRTERDGLTEEELRDWPDSGELSEMEDAAGDCKSQDDAQERIQEDPLSVQVRSDWVNPGEDMEACEFEILLCTGGPAVRIRGELDDFKEPISARIEHQDWGTQWTPYHGAEQATLLAYCQQFYFGE